jgi:hypothetical protein
MAQFNGTFNRTSFFVPVAGLIMAGAVALVAVAWVLGGGSATSVTPSGGAAAAPATRTDRAAILGGIQSEYLRGVAAGWYVAGPRFDPSQLQSEYLREIARDW